MQLPAGLTTNPVMDKCFVKEKYAFLCYTSGGSIILCVLLKLQLYIL